MMKRKTVFLICGSAELHVSLDLFALWGLALVHLQHIKRGFFFLLDTGAPDQSSIVFLLSPGILFLKEITLRT